MISLIWLKIIFLVTLFVSTFTFAFIPYKLVKVTKRTDIKRNTKRCLKSLLSFMNCFAVGVFIGTGLLDLFPSVQNKLLTSFTMFNIETSFPIGEFILMFGFLVIFVIEQIVVSAKENIYLEEKSPLLKESFDGSVSDTEGYENLHASYGSLDSCTLSREEIEDQLEDHAEEMVDKGKYEDPNSQSVFRSLMLMCALSLHSVFEGLAIGLQNNISGLLTIFFPVALHKSTLAMALGLSLVKSRLSFASVLKSNVTFALSSPIGIAIGLGIVNIQAGKGAILLTSACLEGLACGSFLFVGFFEILPHEFMSRKRHPNRLLKTLVFILGFCIVIVIVFISPNDQPICANYITPSS